MFAKAVRLPGLDILFLSETVKLFQRNNTGSLDDSTSSG